MDAKMNLTTQLGYHFYADKKHYTRAELGAWLEAIGGKAQWICLQSSCHTAIPEVVLLFCEENKIKPVIQFDLTEWSKASPKDFVAILQYYQRKGIRFIQLDGYFNLRKTWKTLENGTEFLMQLSSTVIDFHHLAEEYGFYHVLPKLKLGGDYWDLVVLKFLLQQLHQADIECDILVLSFAAWINNHSLLWGKGGKQKWTEPQPYQETFSGEDHRGFMGFEWYQEIAEEEFGHQIPLLILDGAKDLVCNPTEESKAQIKKLFEFLSNENNAKAFTNVLGVCLAYNSSFYTSEITEYVHNHVEISANEETVIEEKTIPKQPVLKSIKHSSKLKQEKCISHYLLLPEYDWGISPWHLEVALPFIRKYRPTIGYSIEEAKNATFVTIVMDQDVFTDNDIDSLQQAGCKTAVIFGDGTEIAAKLATD